MPRIEARITPRRAKEIWEKAGRPSDAVLSECTGVSRKTIGIWRRCGWSTPKKRSINSLDSAIKSVSHEAKVLGVSIDKFPCPSFCEMGDGEASRTLALKGAETTYRVLQMIDAAGDLMNDRPKDFGALLESAGVLMEKSADTLTKGQRARENEISIPNVGDQSRVEDDAIYDRFSVANSSVLSKGQTDAPVSNGHSSNGHSLNGKGHSSNGH